MNFILGAIMLWLAFEHMRDALDPNRLTRMRVQINSAIIAILMGFLGLVFIGAVGPGPA